MRHTTSTPDHNSLPLLLDLRALRERIGLPYRRETIWRMRRRGEFPEPVKLTPGRTLWRRDDVLRWVEQRSAR